MRFVRLAFEFGFFFQAEDGIRVADVTGVQTCALPISPGSPRSRWGIRPRRWWGADGGRGGTLAGLMGARWREDRKSTRLNSSHVRISYAVFCLKKKKSRLVGLSRR